MFSGTEHIWCCLLNRIACKYLLDYLNWGFGACWQQNILVENIQMVSSNNSNVIHCGADENRDEWIHLHPGFWLIANRTHTCAHQLIICTHTHNRSLRCQIKRQHLSIVTMCVSFFYLFQWLGFIFWYDAYIYLNLGTDAIILGEYKQCVSRNKQVKTWTSAWLSRSQQKTSRIMSSERPAAACWDINSPCHLRQCRRLCDRS